MKTNKLARLTIVSVTLALFSGCATLKKIGAETPASTDVNIGSTPAGATVYLDGKEIGTTPVVASNLDASKTYDATLMLKGYQIADTSIRAVPATNLAGPYGKSGVTFYNSSALPGEVNVTLEADKDPYQSLNASVAKLDALLKKGKINLDEYKARSAEVARFYGEAK